MDLLNLSRCNDVYGVEEIIKGADVNFRDFDGVTALQLAVANDFICIVDILVKHGADLNISNNYGWTPLMHSAYNGNFGMADHLLKQGANYTLQNKLGLTATVIAACCGHINIVQLLLNADDSKKQTSNSNCELGVLLGAALFGRDEIVNFLIMKGMDVNHSTITARLSPLMLASCLGQLNVVKTLVKSGADFHLANICHKNALQMAAACSQWEIKMYLKDKMPYSIMQSDLQSEMQLLDATSKGDIDLMKVILKKHSDLNMSISTGKGPKLTPLMQAAIQGSGEAVSVLIKHGANVNIQDPTKGFTALMYAVHYNKLEVVKILLKAGAIVNVQSAGGFSAIDLAWTLTERSEIIELLLMKKKKKNLATLTVSGTLESSSATPKTRKSSSLPRKDSLRSLVDNLAIKFQNIRKRSSAPTTPKSPQSFSPDCFNIQYIEDENVFMDSQDSGSSRFSGKSSGTFLASNNLLKLSASHFPQLDTTFLNKDILKPITPLLKHNSSLLNLPNIENKKIRSNEPFEISTAKCSKAYIFVYKLQIQKKQLYIKNLKEQANLKVVKTYSLPQTQGSQKRIFKNSFRKRQITSIKTGSDHVKSILRKLSLEMYINVFIDNEVDFETLKAITEDDLHEMGVAHPDHCQKLLNYVAMN